MVAWSVTAKANSCPHRKGQEWGPGMTGLWEEWAPVLGKLRPREAKVMAQQLVHQGLEPSAG